MNEDINEVACSIFILPSENTSYTKREWESSPCAKREKSLDLIR